MTLLLFSFIKSSYFNRDMRIKSHVSNFLYMKKLMLVLIVVLYSQLNYDYIAGKLKGEGASLTEDLFIMSCTVKNRLEKGWNPKYVMNAYIAPYSNPSEEEVNFVKDVIENSDDCPAVYFFYSDWAVDGKEERPLLKSYGNSYFSYEQYKKLWRN